MSVSGDKVTTLHTIGEQIGAKCTIAISEIAIVRRLVRSILQ